MTTTTHSSDDSLEKADEKKEITEITQLEREGKQTLTARESASRLALLGGTEKDLSESKRRRTNRG